MNYYLLVWVLYLAILIYCYRIDKRIKKRPFTRRFTFIALVLILFSFSFMPRKIFGTWNSISRLNGKVIAAIHLQPALPDWKVNLTGRDYTITDSKQIDTIVQLLKKAEVYSPSHPSNVWETKMILVAADGESFEILVNKTGNNYNGTYFITPSSHWRKDEIGSYLEKLTGFQQPVYSDTSTNRN
ncbi:hypothetical protein A4D02_26985 [Niastella koreensis]|uniref:Uncharacterized protein n=2 Tax=Niastella koreensis TaxID=354356 RepID=G8TFQ0_NIAKG|nr:hypothetical protein [Niastella koreensis]AEV99489.1 hypothetical protein Niako_3159 [Niastella koreensis GR20-10]OQP50082.1 hypothetical protein A4D02_26985 [Niastella koreensis]